MSHHIKSKHKRVSLYSTCSFSLPKKYKYTILRKFNQKKLSYIFPLKSTIFTKRKPFPNSHVHTRAHKSTSKIIELRSNKKEKETEREKSEREENKAPQSMDIYTHI